jgi:hypothetical protein
VLLVPAVLAADGPSLAVNPSSYDFGRINAGTTASQTFTFTTPKATLKGLTVTLTGSTRFSTSEDTCSDAKSLAPKHPCTVTVVFAPLRDGEGDTGTLTVSSAKPAAGAAASLTGTSPPSTFSEVSPTARSFDFNTEWRPAHPSHGDVAGAQARPAGGIVLPPTSASTSGCTPADFVGSFAGKVALIQRGGCNDGVKVLNAQAAGAVAVVIFNDGSLFDEILFDDSGNEVFPNIPVALTSFDVGLSLYDEYQAGTPPVLDMSVH